MQLKDKAIVIKAVDKGEKDKTLTLFCLENGLIKVNIKGVKGEKAKLKAVAMSFCFAEFEFAEKNGCATVTGANLIENFYGLAKNYDAYLEGCNILKTIEFFASFGEFGNKIFVNMLKALKKLSEEAEAAYQIVGVQEKNIRLTGIKFLISIFEFTGFNLAFDVCSACGNSAREVFFDYSAGEVLCRKCSGSTHEILPLKIISLINLIKKTDYEKLGNIKISQAELNNISNILKFHRKLKIY